MDNLTKEFLREISRSSEELQKKEAERQLAADFEFYVGELNQRLREAANVGLYQYVWTNKMRNCDILLPKIVKHFGDLLAEPEVEGTHVVLTFDWKGRSQ